MRLTVEQLMAAMPRLKSESKALTYIEPLNLALVEFGIATPRRAAAFLAQIAHESGSLRYWEERWGPTAQQLKYDPPHKVAQRLGNIEKGDGFKYRGRGPIQITGRANYKTFGELLNLPLLDEPDLAALPANGFRIAGCFWKRRGLNQLADLGTEDAFKEITRRINGGYTHLWQRKLLWERAKRALEVK